MILVPDARDEPVHCPRCAGKAATIAFKEINYVQCTCGYHGVVRNADEPDAAEEREWEWE